MNPKERVFHALKQKWYAQGFNGTPLHLLPCGASGFDLDPILQDHFKQFIYEFREEYGKMYYPVEDLKRLAGKIMMNLTINPQFLQQARAKYNQEVAWAMQQLISLASQDLATLSGSEFLRALQKAVDLLRVCVGLAHLIEPFALTTDVQIKEKLSAYIHDAAHLNQALSLLCAPTEKSFLKEREDDLSQISTITASSEKQKRIEQHLQRFFYVRNTYAGRVEITSKEIEEEVRHITPAQNDDLELKQKKEKLLATLALDKELILLLQASEFLTNWQDLRKKNILVGVDYMERLLEELSRRTGITISLLRYLTPPEINAQFLFKNREIQKILEERQQGVVCYQTHENGEEELIVLTQKDFLAFHAQMGLAEKKDYQVREFNGLSASTGTAVGPVKICRTLHDIEKVQEGDILVASMTRPEFLPAMKKAAAFITDEGGITCHAAIIAREMRKPCIIGTKIGTQVLRDGDIVEVKANHAVVLILK